MNKQIRHLGYFLMALFLILFVQLNNVQVLQAEKFAEDPRNNRTAVKDFSSERGNIQTADGTVIATSVPVESEYNYLRTYPEGDLYGHVTGFFSFNYGNEGLERTYNEQLTGQTFSLTSLGDLLKDRVNVNNLTISINHKLQQTARQALGNRKGAVVAINPETGAILAMYSYPSFDPTALSTHDFAAVRQTRDALLKNPDNPMLPRAYRESYPPGSTFKVVTAAAAYESQPQLTTKRYPQLRFLDLPNSDRNLRNFGGASCGGSLPDLLRVSCNTGFAQLGLDVGGPAMIEQAQEFGFNKVPPLDLPAPARSRFPESFGRNDPFLAIASIGQGNVSSTPLQMALVAAAIANDGVVMEPQVMSEIRNKDGDVVGKARPNAWARAMSASSAEKLRQNMVAVVRNGTAAGAAVPGVQVAAKTGTAETANNLVDTWMIAFAPAEDPKIAVAVIVEDQPGVSESTGGRVAAPIVKQMISTYLGGS